MTTNVYVITRAPEDSGNMALHIPFFATEDTDKYGLPVVADAGTIQDRIRAEIEQGQHPGETADEAAREFSAMLMTLRAPVFHPGEILFLDDDGREVVYPGRKPGKWDVDAQHVGHIDAPGVMQEALALSQRIRDELSEAGGDPDVLAAIQSIKEGS